MAWWVVLNIILYLGAGALFFTGFGWWALACFVAAFLLSLFLSRGQLDFSDILFFLD